MDSSISFQAALVAGVISFLSPCVLPLVPPYLCFITGASLEELSQGDVASKRVRRGALWAAIYFVAGFSAVFVLLGASVGIISVFLRSYLTQLSMLAGIAIIVMGLHFLGVLRIPLLNREVRYHQEQRPASLLGSFGIGAAFAFGWTPCIGPVLAAIMSLAASQQSPGRAAALLAVYSAGLGIPFLLAAASLGTFMSFFARFKTHMRRVEQVMGLLLIVTGIMFLTGAMQRMAVWLLDVFPWLATIG